MLEHQFARGLVLGVEGIQTDFAPVQIELLEEFAGHGNFVGFGVHDRAAQVMLAGHRYGRQHRMASAVPRLLAIQNDEFVRRSRPADLFLYPQENFFQSIVVHVLHETAEGGLAGSRVDWLLLLADAQSAALGLTEALGEFGEVFLAPWRAAPVSQHSDGHQAPERIKSDALAVIGQAFEILD